MRHLVFAALLVASGPSLAQAEDGGSLTVPIDQARILRISGQAGSVIVGNPSIADITIHDARTLIVTGRSYGLTNLVVLDADGDVLLDDHVMVSSVEDHSVRVFRQASRMTYSCSPACEPKLAIGDDTDNFGDTISQISQHDAISKPSN